MFSFIKRRRLKKRIFNEFVQARSNRDYEKISILAKRYLKLK